MIVAYLRVHRADKLMVSLVAAQRYVCGDDEAAYSLKGIGCDFSKLIGDALRCLEFAYNKLEKSAKQSINSGSPRTLHAKKCLNPSESWDRNPSLRQTFVLITV